MDWYAYLERVKMVEARKKELLNNPGWYIDYEHDHSGNVNIITNGLQDNFSHPDIQIALPVSPEAIHPILICMVELIKNGKVFSHGERSSDILEGYDVSFQTVRAGNRSVLRMLMPDKNGKLPFEEGCQEFYKSQFSN